MVKSIELQVSNLTTNINQSVATLTSSITSKILITQKTIVSNMNGTLINQQVTSVISNINKLGQTSASSKQKVKVPFDTMSSSILQITKTLSGLPGQSNAVLKNVLGVWTNFEKGMNIIGSLQKSKQAITEIFTLLKGNPLMIVITVITLLIAILMQAYQSNEGFRNTVNNLFKSISTALMPILNTIGAKISEIWHSIIVPLSGVVLAFWKNTLEPVASFLIGIFNAHIGEIIKSLQTLWINVLQPLVSFLTSMFLSTLSNVFNALGGVIHGATQIFQGLIDFISGVFTGNWQKAFGGLKEIVAGVFNSLRSIISIPINGIIDMINTVIRGIDGLNINIAGFHLGFNIPQLPRMATGGVVSSATLALIGEAGREAVMPLENNTGWMGTLAATIARQVEASGGDSGDLTITMPIYLDQSNSLIDTLQKKIVRKSRNTNAAVFA